MECNKLSADKTSEYMCVADAVIFFIYIYTLPSDCPATLSSLEFKGGTMFTPLLFCFFVGYANAEYGWKSGTQYGYELRGRTLTGLFQAADQYSGMCIRAKVAIQAASDSVLSIQVHGAEYAEIHANLSQGWSTEIPDDHLHYSSLPIHIDPFEVHLQNGVVKEMVVDKSWPTWEINMLKSIVSLLQVDTQGENLKQSKTNLLPRGDDITGVYKTMEDSIHGRYETEYDVSELPEFIAASRPEVVPLPHLKGNGKIINILKNMNFSNSKQHMEYHHSMNGRGKWEPASNVMGNLLSRTSGSSIVVTGNLKRYVIQSSVNNEKIVIAPHLYNNQKGIVATRMNLTLQGVSPAQGPAPPVSNPMKIKDLVYKYEQQKGQKLSSHDDSATSSTSSSTSNESYENTPKKSRQADPLRRGIPFLRKSQEKMGKYQSSESSSSSSETSDSSSSSSSSSSSASSESSESLSSSEEHYHAMSEFEQAPQADFLLFHVGYQGQTIQKDNEFRATEQAIRMSREIGSEIQHPESISGESTLSKFSNLARLLRIMSAQQLQEVGDQLYSSEASAKQSSEKAKEYHAWIAFRDAVAQAGTGPALVTIRAWVKSGKLQGEEAAQIVAVLPNSVRLPTKDYMEAFFGMVKDSQIQNQRWLNTSATLSFADLVRKSMVDRKDMHDRYPVHMFGPTNNGWEALQKYISYFDEKLKQSVEEGDSAKIQIYINALGQIAHKRILASYEPYLEGQKQVSNYQRLVMVAAMNKLAKTYPQQARAVLYRIYQNKAESPEIRTAAVMQIMKTNPPAQMLQRMAETTNFDHHKQVNSAVKSAIESAARQPINRYNKQLTENARSAVDLLTSENFGVHYSTNFIRSYLIKEQNVGYKQQLSYIQGRDSIFPKTVFYTLKRSFGGFKRDSHEMQFMTSSVDQLIEQLSEQFYKPAQQRAKRSKSEPHPKWSLEKVYEMLNFEEPSQEQLEGNIFITALGGQRYFNFDNHSIEQLPQVAQLMRDYLQNGKGFNYTKLYNQYSYDLAFSTAMGLPFFYTMEVPTVVSFGGQVKASLRNQELKKEKLISVPETLSVDGAYDFVYSAKRQGKMGIVAPFINKAFVAALEKNMQFRIPIRASAGFDLNQGLYTHIAPLNKNEELKLFEYSSDAYTSSHDVLNMKPLKHQKNTRRINIEQTHDVQKTVGLYATGFAFDVSMKGQGKSLEIADIYEKNKNNDLLSIFLYGDMEDRIMNTNLTVVYNPLRSTAEKMKMSLRYQWEDEQDDKASYTIHKRSSDPRNSRNLAVLSSADKVQRQEEFLKKVIGGIKDATGRAVYMSMAFDGKEWKKEYEFNVAYADSPASEESRLLAYLKNSTGQGNQAFQAALQMDMKFPKVPLVNFREAMEANPTSQIKARIDLGENSESTISWEGEMKISPERREYLHKHPLAKQCEREMQEGHYTQPACRNMTARANYLDAYEFAISYKNLPSNLYNAFYKAYRIMNHWGYQYSNETFTKSQRQEGQVNIKVKFGNSLRKMNVTLTMAGLQSQFENVPIHEWLRPVVVVHPEYGMMERLGQKVFRGQQYPVCAFDSNRVTTFDNTSYSVNLGRRPHVLAQSIFSYGSFVKLNGGDKRNSYFSILAQQQTDTQTKIYVLAGDNVLEILPIDEKSAQFVFNDRKFQVEKQSAVPLLDESGMEIMKVTYVPEGAYKILSENFGFKLIYSGTSVRIQVVSGFRGKVRGLCGNYDGETYNDFMTPHGYIVNNTRSFTASYALYSNTGSSEVRMGSQEFLGFKEKIFLVDVITKKDSGMDKLIKESSNSEDLSKLTESLPGYRVKVIQELGKTCFSLKPHLSCANDKSSKLIEKTIDFHCITKSNASKHWEKMVQLGATPDFTQKGANYRVTLKVPEQCLAN